MTKNGNGTVTWFDAHLTPDGVDEAKSNGAYWASQLATPGGAPPPQAYYVSPLYRCLDTANLTFGALNLPSGATPFVPTIKEGLREEYGIATSTRRSNRTYIHDSFPTYNIEAGFTEQDELWKSWVVELPFQIDERTKTALGDIFKAEQTAQIVSITSHSYTTASILRNIGHREFPLDTAGVVPVLVKATGL